MSAYHNWQKGALQNTVKYHPKFMYFLNYTCVSCQLYISLLFNLLHFVTPLKRSLKYRGIFQYAHQQINLWSNRQDEYRNGCNRLTTEWTVKMYIYKRIQTRILIQMSIYGCLVQLYQQDCVTQGITLLSLPFPLISFFKYPVQWALYTLFHFFSIYSS